MFHRLGYEGCTRRPGQKRREIGLKFFLFFNVFQICAAPKTFLKNWLAALCFARSPQAMRASRATNPRPSGMVALCLGKRGQSYVRSVALCREPLAKDTAGVAVVGKMASTPCAAGVV